ncbi:uncharacterized protein EAE97_002140 [Botrytis byssoidea]|uniref:Uncharacterized protein n=1 Tax=Botrytis byssoidea TaxID=139641 RepID=A0A9P5IQJ5_9HELO|nr:uncharacterized protein EAE97_002140 [Botrytis byssoidea]KAF7950588.1 hypothetical protein EAE97_002140 [Botrytis byssoidea]
MARHAVWLRIALLKASLKRESSGIDLDECPSDPNNFMTFLGEINRMLGYSVVAHWILESQGHYFEVTKSGFLKRKFEGGKPVNSVKWSAADRIYNNFLVGYTSLGVDVIDEIGRQMMPSEHYNPLCVNCQTEIKSLAEKIIDDPIENFTWPNGTLDVIYKAAALTSAVAGTVAYLGLDFNRINAGFETFEPHDTWSYLCSISGFTKFILTTFQFGTHAAIAGGKLYIIPRSFYNGLIKAMRFYHDVVRNGWLTALWNATTPSWEPFVWMLMFFKDPEILYFASVILGAFYAGRTAVKWTWQFGQWMWHKSKDVIEVLRNLLSKEQGEAFRATASILI